LLDKTYPIRYSSIMYIVSETPEFNHWLRSIKDKTTRIRLLRRLDKVSSGNLGDVKAVSEGVYEMREHFGAGWRMYYVQRGSLLLLMLGGGDKATQSADIAKAITLSKTV
jgi:putative addiction module killer protein